MRRCLSENTAVDFVQGGLAAEAAAQVEEHLDTCCDCRRFVAAVGQVMSADEEAAGAPATGGPGADGPPAAMEPLARGTAVGRYRVLGPIGAGAMGVVYAAWDAEMEREVALKLLRPAPGCLAADDRMRARLLREAQALARLTHPHVVTAYDVGTHAGGVFVAMELVSGTTLRQWLAERPRQWREVLAVFLQAGAGLAAAHAVGLVHRDFKPDNVIVDGQGRARVVDFGLARLTGEDSGAPAASGDDAASDGAAGRLRSAVLTGAGARVGTPAYMAPEQHLGQRVDPRTDQFSFCVALHEGLYGTRPARAGSDAATEEARLVVPARQAPSPSGVPARLRRVLQRGLCAAPDDRYPSMDTLLFALGRSARPRWRWALALTALVVLAGAAGLGYRGHVVRARQACATDARAQAAVWNEAQKQRIRDAFQATGAAEWERSFRGVVDRIDAYTAKWVVARTEACEATRRGQQPVEVRDLRLQCFDTLLDRVQALAQLLEHADQAVVARAPHAHGHLRSLGGCAPGPALMRRLRPPKDPAARARAASLRTRLMKSAMLLYLGQPRVALAETRAVALAAAEAPTDRSVEAEALVLEGQIHESLGDLRESERVLWRAGAAAEECGHDDIAGQTWIILAGVLAMRYRHAEADRCVDMAAGVIARLGGNKRFDASLALALSRLAQHRGRLGEAQAQAERSQRLLEQIGAIGPIVAEARLRVALVLHDQGKLAAGLGHTEEGLAIMRAFVGPEHPHLAPYWLHLARSLTALGRYDEALDASRRAVDLGRKAQDDNRLLMAESLSVWGDVLVARGRNDEALAAHLEALNLFVLVVGADDPTTALARIGHGQALRAALRLEEALAEQRAAVAVLERVADQRDPQLGSALHELGVTLATQKEPAEALPLLERALALRTKVGVGPAEVAATRFAVAQALVGMRQEHQRARELALLARAEYARAEGRHAATLGEIDRWLAGRSSR